MNAPLILVIDDSLTIRKLLEIVLGQGGYRVSLAASGAEGVERARADEPDLILLDHVLADMPGSEVCGLLAEQERTAALPMVVMPAKGQDVRAEFARFPQVMDFLPKPFAPPDAVNMVKSALQRMSSRTSGRLPQVAALERKRAAPVEVFTQDQKNRAAQACFQAMRARLLQIPAFSAERTSESPAPFFAKRLLGPEVIDGLLAGMLPLYREVIVPQGAAGQAGEGAMLEGQTGIMPLPRLLEWICGLGHTGEFVLRADGRATSFFVRKGEIAEVTHDQPEDYVRGCHNDLARVDAASWERAAAEQRRSAKPIFVTLSELKQLPAAQLPELLHRQGSIALAEALQASPGRFAWRERPTLPAWVEAASRAYHLDQAALERLRDFDDWTQVEAQVTSVDQVYHRGADFAKRIRRLQLTEPERAVLACIDGRKSVKLLAERSGVATLDVFHILFRGCRLGLIALDGAGGAATPAPVMIFDPDLEGVMKPLAKQLKDRVRPVPLLAILPNTDVVQSIVNERPALVLLNAAGIDAPAIARGVRQTLAVSNVPMAAILDQPDEEAERGLREAGFDAVLPKPLHLRDLEQLLESA